METRELFATSNLDNSSLLMEVVGQRRAAMASAASQTRYLFRERATLPARELQHCLGKPSALHFYLRRGLIDVS